MPQLRGNDADQAHFNGGALAGAGPHLFISLTPVADGLWIEISCLSQRFLREKLIDESRGPLIRPMPWGTRREGRGLPPCPQGRGRGIVQREAIEGRP